MTRNLPYDSGPLPDDQEAFWRAIEHGVITAEGVGHRVSAQGNMYRVVSVFDVTTTQSSAYFYVSNPTENMFAQTGQQIKVYDGDANVYIYDEPDLDETTFNTYEFHNMRSDVQANPTQNAYFGYDNNVTINDKGRPFDENFIRAGNKQSKTNGNIEYIIGPNSDALLEVENDSNSTLQVKVSANFYVLPELKKLIDN